VLLKLFRKILKTAIVATLLVVAVAVAAYFFPQKFLCVDSGPVTADVIVVLGGGFGLHERPERAAELLKAGAAPRIIVSGLGDDQINRRILLAAGVPANLIQVESKSRTTSENARFTIKLLREQKVQRVIIVTSWYHSRRALHTFEHYAPDLKFYSRPSYFASTRADWERKNISRHIYLEYVKLPGYWVRYGVWPF
jgi:uncharacterized SAM-binding protein YcdF (DUF218 family)